MKYLVIDANVAPPIVVLAHTDEKEARKVADAYARVHNTVVTFVEVKTSHVVTPKVPTVETTADNASPPGGAPK